MWVRHLLITLSSLSHSFTGLIHTYTHTCMPKYIHTHMQTYMHKESKELHSISVAHFAMCGIRSKSTYPVNQAVSDCICISVSVSSSMSRWHMVGAKYFMLKWTRLIPHDKKTKVQRETDSPRSHSWRWRTMTCPFPPLTQSLASDLWLPHFGDCM